MNLSWRMRLLLLAEASLTVAVLGMLVIVPRAGLVAPVEWFLWVMSVRIVLNVQVLLLAIWAALGRGSDDVRLATASVTAALVLWVPALLVPNEGDAWSWISTYAGGMLTTAILFGLLRFRWAGVQYPPAAVPCAKPWQFSIKGILILTTIVAVLVAARPTFTEIFWNAKSHYGILLPVLNGLQAVGTVWAVLREGRTTERIALVTAVVTCAPLLLFDQTDGTFTPFVVAAAFLEQCLLAGPLYVVRSSGFRLQRRPPDQPSTDNGDES